MKRPEILSEALRCDACGTCNLCGPGWPLAQESHLPRGAVWSIKCALEEGRDPKKLARQSGAYPLFGAAETVCPQRITISGISLAMRVLGSDAAELREMSENIKRHLRATKNPLGVTRSRWDWAGTSIRARISDQGRTLVLGGTLNSLHPDLNGGPLNALSDALRKLNVDFRLFGPAEPFLGWELLCAGDREAARKTATATLVKLKITQVETIISPDATVVCCLRLIWPELLQKDVPFEVFHAAEYLSQHFADRANQEEGRKIILHPGDESFIAGIDLESVISALRACGYEVVNRLFVDRDAPCPRCGSGLPPMHLPEKADADAVPLAVMTTSCRFSPLFKGPVHDVSELLARGILG